MRDYVTSQTRKPSSVVLTPGHTTEGTPKQFIMEQKWSVWWLLGITRQYYQSKHGYHKNKCFVSILSVNLATTIRNWLQYVYSIWRAELQNRCWIIIH